VRKKALASLAELGPDEALPAVKAALRHPSDAVRCAAVRALCGWGEPMPIAAAVAWLPPGSHSRSLAFRGLARLDQPDSAPAVAHSLVHGTAQAGLWKDEVDVVGRLCAAGRDPDACRKVVDLLTDALDHENAEVVGRAEDFLLWLGSDAVPALVAVVRSAPAPDTAVWLLGQIGGASALEPLLDAMEHPEARTREEACAALGELRDPISVEALLRATRDHEHAVRVKAGMALERIGTAAFLAGVSAAFGHQLEPVTEPRRLAGPAENASAQNGSTQNGSTKNGAAKAPSSTASPAR
jgi:HEAT repeat protein